MPKILLGACLWCSCFSATISASANKDSLPSLKMDEIAIDFEDLLGSGTFSNVHGGKLGRVRVAIKVFKGTKDARKVSPWHHCSYFIDQ